MLRPPEDAHPAGFRNVVNPLNIDLGDIAAGLKGEEMHRPGAEAGDVDGELVFDEVDALGFVADLLVDAEQVWRFVAWAVVLDTVGREEDEAVDLDVV